jgi:RNA polymerase sigma-70 factor, ECF subfamily
MSTSSAMSKMNWRHHDFENRRPGSMDVQTLVARQLPSLNRYARYLARNRMRADDLVQETVLCALMQLHRWEVGTDLRAWLFTIMHNQHVNHIRRSIREANHLAEEIPTVSICGRQERSVEWADLVGALAEMPRDVQDIVQLIALDGLAYDEVAAHLGVPTGTVRSRLSRGRRHLRDVLEGRVAAKRSAPAATAPKSRGKLPGVLTISAASLHQAAREAGEFPVTAESGPHPSNAGAKGRKKQV